MSLRTDLDALKYVAAIHITDVTEERVRRGEILAPDWFMRAWVEGWRICEQLQQRAGT